MKIASGAKLSSKPWSSSKKHAQRATQRHNRKATPLPVPAMPSEAASTVASTSLPTDAPPLPPPAAPPRDVSSNTASTVHVSSQRTLRARIDAFVADRMHRRELPKLPVQICIAINRFLAPASAPEMLHRLAEGGPVTYVFFRPCACQLLSTPLRSCTSARTTAVQRYNINRCRHEANQPTSENE